jgi:5-oxoprolinase (ATP-hydrolysing) subunit A
MTDQQNHIPQGHGMPLNAIDINCDMGEGMDNEEAIMPYISAANIACGFHAGNEAVMYTVCKLAMLHGVKTGAHIAFDDREHFGRVEMNIASRDLTQLVTTQLQMLNHVLQTLGGTMHHVKPHGALYNMSARDPQLALTIAQAVKAFNPRLVLYGLSGSYSIREAEAIGLPVANEAFADRTYQDDGSLTPRSAAHAMIHDPQVMLKQVLHVIKNQQVCAVSGQPVFIQADTLCIHGDGPEAVAYAKAIAGILVKEQVRLLKNETRESK